VWPVGTTHTGGVIPTPLPSCAGGEDIHVVQHLMGHCNSATTTRYLHLSDADLLAAVDRAFPES